MNINFENLEKIEDIYKILLLIRDEKINNVEKRWLTTEELSEYIGYSKESIKKMIRDELFIIGLHYHKKLKKNLFDKNEIDKWVVSGSYTQSINVELLTNKILCHTA